MPLLAFTQLTAIRNFQRRNKSENYVPDISTQKLSMAKVSEDKNITYKPPSQQQQKIIHEFNPWSGILKFTNVPPKKLPDSQIIKISVRTSMRSCVSHPYKSIQALVQQMYRYRRGLFVRAR